MKSEKDGIKIEVEQVTMIALLLLTLSISPDHAAAASDEGLADPACRTLSRFEQSLKSDGPLCMDSQPKSKPFFCILKSFHVIFLLSRMHERISGDCEEVYNWYPS